jgi:hypothetical protein
MITMFKAMPPSLSRAWIIGVLAVAMGLLGGCSTVRLAYNQAHHWVYWWLDAYVDFNEAQEPAARELIAGWFGWHRTTQLPEYAQWLAHVEAQALEPTSGAAVCQLFDEGSARMDEAVERAIDTGADLMRRLTPEQIRHVERKYAKGNAQFKKDYLQASGEERLKASVKREVERAEFFYGKLDPAQRDRISQGVSNSPFDPEGWMAERLLRQSEVLQTLRRVTTEDMSTAQAQEALKTLYRHTRHSPRDRYNDYQQRLTQSNCALAAEVHNLTTPAQRREMAKRLRTWQNDFRALAADGRYSAQ